MDPELDPWGTWGEPRPSERRKGWAPSRVPRQNVIAGAVAAGVAAFGMLMFGGGFVLGAFVDDDGGGGERVVLAGPTPAAAGAQAQAPTSAFPQAATPPDVDDDPARGPDDAPILIIEFSDFQCPYCGRFYKETLPQLLENYGDQIRFVYRDFPLERIHPYAQKAAEAAQCASDQDAFWGYHDLLFENQSALDTASLKGYAGQLGLDEGEFATCLDSGHHAAEVQQDLRDGIAAGVQATPTFFINGQQVRGAQPYEVFQSVIEAALAGDDQ